MQILALLWVQLVQVKSTIIDIILGLLEPEQGFIKVDNIPQIRAI